MPSVTDSLSNRIETFIRCLGEWAAWLNLLLVGVIALQVLLRYGFNHGLVPLEELMWHLYATAFMFGLSYGLVTDDHIRVDIFHARFSPRVKALVEILGILLLLIPFAWVILHHSLEWVQAAFTANESSENPTGLPWRWLIKSVIPISFGLLLLAAVSRLLRQLRLLLKGEGE